MTELFNSIDESTASRKNNLKLTSEIADIFWDDLSATTNTLSAIRNTLIEEEQPSVESSYIYYQQSTLEVGISIYIYIYIYIEYMYMRFFVYHGHG